MAKRVRKLRTGALVAPLALGGCLLLTPLDDFENAPKGGAGSGNDDAGGAGQAGESGAGNASGEAGADAVGGAGGSQAGGEGGSAVGKGGGTTAGAAGAEPTGCRTNAECITAAGGAARCRPDGMCVALKTGDCPLAYGDFADDDAIYIGSFAPLPNDVPGSSTVVQAQRLALEEFSGSVEQGLPDATGKRHPIVMIACDSGTTEQVLGAMDHLANRVDVPAVLAMIQPGDMLQVYEDFAEHKIFYLNPVGATRNVVELDDDGLVWNILGQPSDLVPPYLELVSALEAHIRTQRGLGDEPIKVALVTTTDAFNAELANLVGDELEINGLPVSEDTEHYRLFRVRLDDPDETETPAAIGDAVRAFKPDLVISTANETFTRSPGVLERIELDWRLTHGDAPRPFYLLSPYNAGDMDYVKSLVGAIMGLGPNGIPVDATANLRFVGIEAAGPIDKKLQNEYAIRLGEDFPNAGADSGNYYDAFYYLAYAMYAAGAGPELTGPRILSAFQRLLAGPSFDVGPTQIPYVFDALEPEDSSIELVGTLGPPNFFNGIRVDAGSVFCIERDGDELKKVGDALRYNRTTREFDGDFPCFEGFPPASP
jgi:hypothetical protein